MKEEQKIAPCRRKGKMTGGWKKKDEFIDCVGRGAFEGVHLNIYFKNLIMENFKQMEVGRVLQ